MQRNASRFIFAIGPSSRAFLKQSKTLYQFIWMATRSISTTRSASSSICSSSRALSSLDFTSYTNKSGFIRSVQCLNFYSGSSTDGTRMEGDNDSSEISEDDLYPGYIPRTGESVEVKRARLLYQSRWVS